MKIKMKKFMDELKIPTRGHYNDAGLDCYAPNDVVLHPMAYKYVEITKDGKEILHTNNGVTISLGFGLEIPDGYMATIRPRSSMNKKGILTQIGTIDSGYKGEIMAVFLNLTNESYEIKKGDKICQIVIEPVVIADLVEDLGKERGDGGFGSTGK